MARVKFVEKESAPPEVKSTFQKIEDNGARVLNSYKVLANSPAVMLNVIRLGNAVMGQMALPAKLRELVILRVARLTGSEYEWAHHAPLAGKVGLTGEQLGAVSCWQNSSGFSAEERAVLQFTDEVAQNVKVCDRTFDDMKRFFNDQAIVEVTAAVGYYAMLARLLVALQVEVDQVAAGSASDLTGRRPK